MRKYQTLAPYIEERAAWTFGYGRGECEQDCVRFAAGGVLAVTGIDPLSDVTARWSTAAGAARALKAAGGLEAAISSVMAECDVTQAQRGDVGLVGDACVVLVEGETVAGLDPERGLIRLPRSAMRKAWSV